MILLNVLYFESFWNKKFYITMAKYGFLTYNDDEK